MYRWALILPLLFVGGGLPAVDKDRDDRGKDDKKAKAGPLVDVDAFFREYDRNKDGFLTKDELPDWLHYNFARLDTNKDGKVSKEELTAGVAYLQQRRRPSDVVFVLIEMSDCDECCAEELQRVYESLRKLDRNKDGKIDADELKAGRTEVIKERVDGLVKRLDTDRDGKISKQEARGMVKEHFAELDTNKDGFVDRDELIAAASARPADEKGKPDSRREK